MNLCHTFGYSMQYAHERRYLGGGGESSGGIFVSFGRVFDGVRRQTVISLRVVGISDVSVLLVQLPDDTRWRETQHAPSVWDSHDRTDIECIVIHVMGISVIREFVLAGSGLDVAS